MRCNKESYDKKRDDNNHLIWPFFWGKMLRHSEIGFRRFDTTHCAHLQGQYGQLNLRKSDYQVTRRHIAEQGNLQPHHHEVINTLVLVSSLMQSS